MDSWTTGLKFDAKSTMDSWTTGLKFDAPAVQAAMNGAEKIGRKLSEVVTEAMEQYDITHLDTAAFRDGYWWAQIIGALLGRTEMVPVPS